MNFPALSQNILETTSAYFRPEVLDDLNGHISPETFEELKAASLTYEGSYGRGKKTPSNIEYAKSGDILFRIFSERKKSVSDIKHDIIISPSTFCGHFFLVFTIDGDPTLYIRDTSIHSNKPLKLSSLNKEHLFILPPRLHHLVELCDNPSLFSHIKGVKTIESIPRSSL